MLKMIHPWNDGKKAAAKEIDPKNDGTKADLMGNNLRNNGIEAVEKGIYPQNDGTEAAVEGIQPQNDGIGAMVKGTNPWNGEIEAVDKGINPKNNGMEADVKGIDPENSGKEYAAKGINPENDEVEAAVKGTHPQNAGTEAAAKGIHPQDGGIETAVKGTNPWNDGIGAAGKGTDPWNDGMKAAVKGIDPKNFGKEAAEKGINPKNSGTEAAEKGIAPQNAGTEAMLKVDGLRVAYGTLEVVKGVSFALHSGQWLMLCGPNGAGKSTLVKAIAQSARWTGHIALNGRDIRTIRPRELGRMVGVLSQNHQLGYAFTVEEVVALGRYAYGGPLAGADSEGERHIAQALACTGMAQLRRQSMLALSGGEMQRAFLAQVFAQDPALLMLDEPANHLDPVYQRQIFSLIGDWLKQPGRAVISVVHDLSLARRYGTHALLMAGGQAVAQGPVEAVLTRANLNQVYGMDLYRWMTELLDCWRQA